MASSISGLNGGLDYDHPNTVYVLTNNELMDSPLKKKLIFIRRKFRFDGGAEAAAQRYLDVMSERFSVDIVCESWSGRKDIPVTSISTRGYSRAKNYRSFISQAEKICGSGDSLVHSHELVPGADVIRLGDGLHKSWLDKRSMGPLKRRFDGYHRAKLAYEAQTLTHTNLKRIIVISDSIKASLISDYGVDPEKIVLIRNILSERYLQERQMSMMRNGQALLYVGSGFARKGLDLAIEALARLPSEFNLDVIGKDKDVSKYFRLARRLGVSNRVNFLGAFPVTPDVYKSKGVLVHPAIYDPFPNVAMEALSQGVPVVSTFGSGTADFSSDEGVWTSDRDPCLLAKNIVKASEIKDCQRDEFVNFARQFDPRYLQKMLRSLYDDVLGFYKF